MVNQILFDYAFSVLLQSNSSSGSASAISDLVLYGLLAVAGLAFVAMLAQVGLSYLAQRNQNDMYAQALQASAGDRAIEQFERTDDDDGNE